MRIDQTVLAQVQNYTWPPIPINSAQPLVSPLAGGGAFVVWSLNTPIPGTTDTQVVPWALSVSDTGEIGSAMALIAPGTEFSGQSVFAPPVVQSDGSFTLALSGQRGALHKTYTYAFDAELLQIGGETEVADVTPAASYSVYYDSLTLKTGDTLLFERSGLAHLVDPDFALKNSLSTGISAFYASSTQAPDGTILRAHIVGDAISVSHFSVENDALAATGQVDLFPDIDRGYRTPELVGLEDGYVFVTSNRVSEQIDGVWQHDDTVNIRFFDQDTGDVTLLDAVSRATGTIFMSNAAVATPDGGFAVMFSERLYETGEVASFSVRRYDADGVFRAETSFGTDLGSTNNGGFDHDLNVLEDGSLLAVWQTSTVAGIRGGGYWLEWLAPDLHGTSGMDILSGSANDDRINGHGGADILTGAAGSDVFVFGIGEDTARITDFEAGTDMIDLTQPTAHASTLLDQLMTQLVVAPDKLQITQSGTDTAISLGTQDDPIVILEDISAQDVQIADILF